MQVTCRAPVFFYVFVFVVEKYSPVKGVHERFRVQGGALAPSQIDGFKMCCALEALLMFDSEVNKMSLIGTFGHALFRR